MTAGKDRRAAGGFRKLTVLLGVLVGGLLLVEGALRIRQKVKYGTFSTTFYELEYHEPSGLYIHAPGSEVGSVRVNSLGFRGAEVEVPKPPGRLRVAFLGGSTTFCAEASGLEATWPDQVVGALAAAHPECDIDYVNGAAGGYSTRESTKNLVHRVAPLEPDVLVIYHGTNELTQDSREVAAERGLFDPEVQEQTWLGEVSLAWFLIEKNLRFGSRKADVGGERLEEHPRTYSDRFRARLTGLIEEARRIAPVVCVVTFSHRARRDHGPAQLLEASSSSRYYMPYLSAESILDGFEEYNRVVREVAAETGVILVEDEYTIPGDGKHFADSVHLTDAGCALQAERVIVGLEASAAFQALVASTDG